MGTSMYMFRACLDVRRHCLCVLLLYTGHGLEVLRGK
jgi:hypothetical protein